MEKKGRRKRFLDATFGRLRSRSSSRNRDSKISLTENPSSGASNSVLANNGGGGKPVPDFSVKNAHPEQPSRPPAASISQSGTNKEASKDIHAPLDREPHQARSVRSANPENATSSGSLLPGGPKVSLWEQALQQLREDNKTQKLISEFEDILKAQADKIPENDQETSSQPEQFSKVIKLGMDQIESKLWKLRLDPKHSIVVRDQINRILKTVKQFSGILAVAASFDPVHAGVAWAGISAVLPFLLNISEQDEALVSGIDFIADRIAWYAPVESLLSRGETQPSAELNSAIVKVYKAILLYQAMAACHVHQGTLSRAAKDILATNAWAENLQKIKDADTNCQTFVQTASTELLRKDINKVQEMLSDLKGEPDVLRWLIAGSQSQTEVHHKIRRAVGVDYENSGKWLLRPTNNESAYLTWKGSDRGQLSLQGSVGMGKTTLTSMVVEDLGNDASRPNLAYYYCKRDNPSSIDAVMRSILAQLVFSDARTTTIHALEDFRKNRERRPDADECVLLLREAVFTADATVILVDGWDESEKPNALLKYLNEVWNQSTRVKLFLSSRIESNIRNKLPRAVVVRYGLDDNSDDVRSYIKMQLKDPARRNPEVITERLAQDMVSVLLRGAGGMFLWVKLQLDLLISAEDPIESREEFQRRLDALSNRSSEGTLQMLNQTYDDILERNLKNQGKEASKSAEEALQWIACSGRPFKKNILLEAVQANTKDTRTYQQLEKWCRNLLYANKVEEVHFTHPSVRDYIETKYSLAAAHMMVVQTCLLSFKPHDQSEIASYANFYWPFHCGQAVLGAGWEKGVLGERLLTLLSPSHGRRKVWQSRVSKCNSQDCKELVKATSYWSLHCQYPSRIDPQNFLLACHFNWLWYFLHPVKIGGVDFEEDFKEYSGTGLVRAIKQRHEGIVHLLLDRGASVTYQENGDDVTALGAATLTNQPSIVKMLVGNSEDDFESLSGLVTRRSRTYADVNKVASLDSNTALHLTALHNLPEIAQILCDVGDVNVNVQNDKDATPLLDAAAVGAVEVVRILLKHPSIDLKAMGYLPDGQQSPLHCTESPTIAAMLLDHDRSIANLMNNEGNTVLSHWLKPRRPTGPYADAAYERDLQARLTILLQCQNLKSLRGTPLTPHDEDLSKDLSALQLAATKHSAAVFQIFYEDARFDPLQKDPLGNTLLHLATLHENLEVVRFLLDREIDISAQNKDGKTALTIAKESQKLDVVKILEPRLTL